jgi:hypothetical protein
VARRAAGKMCATRQLELVEEFSSLIRDEKAEMSKHPSNCQQDLTHDVRRWAIFLFHVTCRNWNARYHERDHLSPIFSFATSLFITI